MRNLRKKNIICIRDIKQQNILLLTEKNLLLPKQGHILKGRICSLWEQILPFKISLNFGRNAREIVFFNYFLGVRKNNSILATPVIALTLVYVKAEQLQ